MDWGDELKSSCDRFDSRNNTTIFCVSMHNYLHKIQGKFGQTLGWNNPRYGVTTNESGRCAQNNDSKAITVAIRDFIDVKKVFLLKIKGVIRHNPDKVIYHFDKFTLPHLFRGNFAICFARLDAMK
jgi:hypothetical protein